MTTYSIGQSNMYLWEVTIEEFQTNILPLKNRLFRFALTFLRDEHEARDVVQDVMIKMWEGIEDISKIKNIQAFCMTMVRNRSLDMKRKKGRQYVDVAEQIDIETDRPTPSQHVVTNDRVKIVHEAIAQLSEQQQTVIQLRDIEGYKYKEIAEMTGLELNHVKVLLHRGRLAIKNYISSHYGTDMVE